MIARLKHLLANPLVFGVTSGLIVVLIDLAIGTWFEGSLQAGYEAFAHNDPLWYLVPVAVSAQMGLLRYYLNLPVTRMVFKTERLGVVGSAFTSVTLVTCCVACCVMPIWSLLPAMGMVLAVSAFFMEYSGAILLLTLLANMLGSTVLLLLIYHRKKA